MSRYPPRRRRGSCAAAPGNVLGMLGQASDRASFELRGEAQHRLRQLHGAYHPHDASGSLASDREAGRRRTRQATATVS
jgi:hypothetical protein